MNYSVARRNDSTAEQSVGKGVLEFDSLMQVSYLAGESLDLDLVLPKTLAGIADLLPADRLVVLHESAGRLTVHSSWAKSDAKTTVRWGEIYPKRGCVEPASICHYRLDQEEEARCREIFPYLIGAEAIEALVIPLHVEGQSVGRLDIVRECGASFDDWERRFAEACGKILSLTVRNGMEYARVAWLAEHDALTGIGNRRQFDAALSRELTRAERYGRHLSLLLIDLDDFKEVNTHLGLSGGDEILRRTARVLSNGARKGLDISCRIGGDEFAMILPEISEESASELAQRLLREVIKATAPLWPMRFSYSVSTYPDIDSEFFRRNADTRLRDAKTHKEEGGVHPFTVVQ